MAARKKPAVQKLDVGLREIPIEQFIFLRRNPQYLTPHQMEALKASIRRDGFLAPVLCRPVEGGYEIVSGNHRVMAARENGMKIVPAVVASLTDQQAARLAINLNTVHGDPPAALLAPFLAELDDETLRSIHLDAELMKEVGKLDDELRKAFESMQAPDEFDAASPQTEIAPCICPTCGKQHIRGRED